ncbi:MAG TPA: hypothetical protein PKA41_03195, partial [Verrucomicrobiota bacterium]|nr:hypothetical protein [Verrucomicrobiota bacterium]
RNISGVPLVGLLCLIRLVGNCGTVDVSKLPPPADIEIQFARDIQPILDKSCLRCHGFENHKAGLRLTSRESSLRGGDNGAAIIPGDSAKSPLIHYVARLVPDMEMPPEGKGDPLSTEQVALLRAWIDQGVQWPDDAQAGNQFDITPTVGFTTVTGDEDKFRSLVGRPQGWDGGASAFEFKGALSPDSKVSISGHAIRDDYEIVVLMEKADVGFTRFGWEQYRKYYDDSGGYAPPLPVFDLDRDLHLDIGRTWLDFGLTMPNWPRVTVGYEYQYRDGTKSTLAWGASPSVTNNILPAYKDIEEHTHVLKLDISHDVAGMHLENSFRGEFYSLTAKSAADVWLYEFSAPTNEKEKSSYFQGANAFTMDRRLNRWLFATAGYYYSNLDGDGSVNLDTASWSSVPAAITDVNFKRESHIVSASALLGPWNGLSFTAAVQSDWTCQSGSGNANADLYFPIDVFDEPSDFNSDLNRTTVEQNVALRYAAIPFTTLFAEGRFQQECVGLNEYEESTVEQFNRKTDATGYLNRFRAGISSSPWRWMSFNANYLLSDRCVDYDHPADESLIDGEGYSAFITARDIFTQEFETKLTLRPRLWWNATLSYRRVKTDYDTTTEPTLIDDSPGGKYSSSYEADIYSLGAMLTPWKQFHLSTTFSYRDTRTRTVAGPDLPVVPYRGDVYSVANSAKLALNKSTDLLMSYVFALADYSDTDAVGGIRFGAEYEQHAARVGIKRRLGPGASVGLEYAWYHYDEPSSGGHNNFTAHSVFVSVSCRLP